MLHYDKPKELQALLPSYVPRASNDGLDAPGAEGQFPSATYLRVLQPPRAP